MFWIREKSRGEIGKKQSAWLNGSERIASGGSEIVSLKPLRTDSTATLFQAIPTSSGGFRLGELHRHIITNMPKELVPLAKLSPDDPTTVEVFELCINGQEIAPGYTEQN